MKNKSTKLFALYFTFFYALSAITTTQLIPFLTDIGYSPSERSQMFVMGALASILLQLLISYLSDKFQTIKRVLIPLFILYISLVFFFYKTQRIDLLYHLLFFSLVQGLYTGATVFSDSWVLESEEETRANYGLIRGFGSAGWILGTFIVAWVIGRWGYSFVIVASLLIFILIMFILVFIEDNKASNTQQASVNLSDIKELIRSRPYRLAVIIVFFFTSVTIIDSISIIDKTSILGGSEGHVAAKFMITALIEIPFFFLGRRILSSFDYLKVLTFSASMYVITHLSMAYTNSASVLVLISSIQGIAFSSFLLSNRNLIFDLSTDHMKSTGQMFAGAIVASAAGQTIPLGAGYLTEYFNVNVPLFLAAFAALASLLMIPILRKELNHE